MHLPSFPPAVTVNISDIYPLPQKLSQNGSNIVVNGKQAMLFRPVIHLFGNKNRTLNGEVLKELEYDTMNNPINFINKYIVLPTNFTAKDTLSFMLDQDQLDEGYYKLSAKIALVSQFPDLVDLDGRTTIVQVSASQLQWPCVCCLVFCVLSAAVVWS